VHGGPGCAGSAPAWTLAGGVGDGIDGVKREAFAFVLDPGRLVVDEAARDGDDAAGQVALVELEVLAVNGDRGIPAHAPSVTHGQRSTELVLVEVVETRRGLRPDNAGLAAHEPSVRRRVVVLVEPGPQPYGDIVQR
jgi:hypothetical protein